MIHTRQQTIGLLVAFVVLLVAVGCSSAPAGPPPTPTERVGHPDAFDLANEPAIGPANAPVVIQEYSDYSCLACAVWEGRGIRKQLLAKYGDKVRFVWHDYAVLTPRSRPSSLAARCAGDQGQYWAYHDVLFANYPDLDYSNLRQYAADLKLDAAAFNTCLVNQTDLDALGAGLQDGMSKGFFATPAFLVNDTHVLGGQTFDYFVSVIDPLLAAAKS